MRNKVLSGEPVSGPAVRISRVPPYLFAEIDRKREEALARGVDVIDLGIGDPVEPTPAHVVEALAREARNPAWHRYPSYAGDLAFREAAAEWMERRFGVELDPRREVMALIGSKEGLAHMVWAYTDPGDPVIVPDPGYPVYRMQALLAGGEPYLLKLDPERGFLPSFDSVPREVARKARVMFLNFPHNPTAAVADLAFFEEAVDFCRRHGILLCHDAAYSEITFDGFVAPSVLEVPGAKEVSVEFHSLSKPFNMTGWRIGFAAGNAQALEALGVVKTNTDSGQFTAIQRAAVTALRETPREFFSWMKSLYRRRRDLVVSALRRAGIEVRPPRGTFYVWAPVPEGHTSASFAAALLERAGVIVAPGSGYGPGGEGYFRISLTVPDERLEEAMERLVSSGWT